MEQIITLRVRYEDDPDLKPKDPPALWNWSDLAGEDVEVIQSLPVTQDIDGCEPGDLGYLPGTGCPDDAKVEVDL